MREMCVYIYVYFDPSNVDNVGMVQSRDLSVSLSFSLYFSLSYINIYFCSYIYIC